MKNFAFVSDFDGTLTKRDFYHIIIDKYLGQMGKIFYSNWKANKKINVEFLNKVFGWINLSETKLKKEIYSIEFDSYAIDFIKKFTEELGDFYILSAGTSYYIDILLDKLEIKNVNVFSMHGEYKNGGILITPDKTNKYYSEIFGIDKGKFVSDLKLKYDKVFYSGDSEPDLSASKVADLTFAKSELQELLIRDNVDFIPMESYSNIADYFREMGYFK